jgi:hypothetical protein
VPAIIGSAVGGGLGAFIAPATYASPFAGPLAGQLLQRGIAGIPGAGVSTTGGIVGNRVGR